MSAISDQIAAQAQAMTEAMRTSCADPTDAIRILAGLLATPLPLLLQPDAAAAQAALAAVFRRAALGSIALACADYQPASSTEAAAMIARVGNLLEAEIIAAADAGQTASYVALKRLRQGVVADLRARSANLPSLVTVSLPGNLPSLAAAYRLYGDAMREPGLVARAACIHPGFMPPSYEALSA